MIANAEAINTNPDYLLSVGELRVFGSYLDPAMEMLGDIDISCQLVRRSQYEADWCNNCVARVRKLGRRLETILAIYSYPEREVMSALRKGTRYAQFTLHDTLARLGVESRVIFPKAE